MHNEMIRIALTENEQWWGGAVGDGIHMPFGSRSYQRDLFGDAAYNQACPLLLSNKGRSIWSEEPFRFAFEGSELVVEGKAGTIKVEQGGDDLRDAFRYASKTYFPASGTLPDEVFFAVPQYNTWMEMGIHPTQEKVLAYAEAIIGSGLPPGILMIDDNWHEDYGTLVFHPGRFPDPKAMIEQLHALGFRVMLWVCPFISPDGEVFRYLHEQGYLLREADGRPVIRKWWNGYSAVLDGSNEEAMSWFTGVLDRLMDQYGVDGFKLDAGDPQYYEATDVGARPATPNEQCEIWARLGLRYAFNEYRACWKLAGQPLVQRLADKNHSWGTDGLASLIPNGLAQGLIGYAFNCPDMVGGGQYGDLIRPDFQVDGELFVRYAQCSALFPMMQFSTAPWRVLGESHLALCIEAAQLHCRMGDEITELARHAAATGEPIMRHMAYVFPSAGYETITDQFMLGDNILVAPVIQKGATARNIVFPEGTWIGDDGSEVVGPCEAEVEAPLSRLPWYCRG
ncbi:alpha-glucosidase (family GH31 glycosyl hydrolase) [Paenibacillus phyllosphaerae]|uniref:Alpha-glucosidase (Family GH31 glycosyl hydrolase) n=1 Tax=Paenibacillus phyllosphaerae TaxID=274593 RepID=A0A7W5B259_9BACL|nr:glycoside hydrolase family 31 protein [Paenibacillus phyllosphaerae]MBB3113055.1 alpha-glucosidase (family GH31 glycosyl hydrolase) [Paenibacillus phyllosphaerae]